MLEGNGCTLLWGKDICSPHSERPRSPVLLPSPASSRLAAALAGKPPSCPSSSYTNRQKDWARALGEKAFVPRLPSQGPPERTYPLWVPLSPGSVWAPPGDTGNLPHPFVQKPFPGR